MLWINHIWVALSAVDAAVTAPHPPARQAPAAGLRLALALLWLASVSGLNAHPTQQNAPEFLIDRWETEDGLPENSATAMVQTPDGYLWIGTYDGLARFDGDTFKVFNRSNTPELPSAGIINLHLDQSGRLWVSTLSGLVVREGDKWRAFGSDQGWVGDFVRTFSERANGDLLMTTFDGRVLVFENGSDRLNELPSPPGAPNQGYQGAVDGDGQWWVTQKWFVGRWNGEAWVTTLTPDPSLGMSRIACHSARDGGVWILLGTELLKFRNGMEVSRRTFPTLKGGIWGLYEDRDANLWITTYNVGLFLVTKTGEIRNWNSSSELGHKSCRFAFEDREANLWVGTSGRGLRRFKPRRFVDMSTPALAEGSGKSICLAREGGMWITSYGASGYGLFHCDDSGNVSEVPLPGPGNETNYGLSVLEDRNGRLWHGNSNGAWRRQGESTFEPVLPRKSGGATTQALFEDSQGRVWMSSGVGVVVCEDGAAFREIGESEGLPKGVTYCFAEDSRGTIWLAGTNGVFGYESDRVVPMQFEAGLAPTEVLSLKADPDGTMWMGIGDTGLWRWRNGVLDRVALPEGIPLRSAHAIIDDGLGYFWITSNRGIIRAARKDLHATADGSVAVLDCQLLDRHDGLPGNEFPLGQPTCARDARGRLWFVLNKGVAVIDPANFRLNTLPPPVHLQDLTYRLRTTVEKSGVVETPDTGVRSVVRLTAPFSEPLKLPPGTHSFAISYSAPSFSSSEKVRFQTMLEGADSSWRDGNKQRQSRLYGLAPGDYVFRVRAANNDGVWNKEGASLAFIVQPFFWQTTWFIGGGVAGLVGVVGGGLIWGARRRNRAELRHLEHTRQQQAELEHLSRVTMLGELSGSLAHELNQPLTAILSNAQAALRFLAREDADLDEVREILADIVADDQRAGDVIRRLRLLLKKGELQLVQLDLNALVREVLKLVSNDLLNHSVALEIELVPGPLPICGDPVNLQQVILNLVINATDAMAAIPPSERCLRVRSERTDAGSARVSICDSGEGIATDSRDRIFESFFTTKANGMGLGLKVCLTIIEAHEGQLVGDNNPDRGATFHFTLPLAETERGQA
ncbi:MAG: signal transduction histidine kinase/ligand-binding sensor domain-containing protein [Verrucomicrobiales bacterium]|jgi:signal transduction histidine kinase/ligand-binding sensor domain-containing protein